MKKLKVLTAIFCLSMCFAFSGCGKNEIEEAPAVEETESETAETVDEKNVKTEEKSDDKTKPEEEAAVEETEEEEVEETKVEFVAGEVLNNGGHFLGIGDWVYYLEPSDEAMQSSQINTDFIDCPCGETVLQSYNLKAGNLNPLFTDFGYGELWMSGEYMFVDVYEPDNEESNKVVMYNLVSGTKEYAKGDNLVMGDSKGQYVVTIHYGDEANTLSVYKDGSFLTDISQKNYVTCVGIEDGYLVLAYYIDADYNVGVKCINLEDNQETYLGPVPEREMESYENYPTFGQYLIEDGKLYLSIYWCEGTGHFLAEQAYAVADLSTENSLERVEITGTNNLAREGIVDPFVVKNGKMQKCSGVPGKAFYDYETGEYGFIDENGNPNLCGSGFETRFADDGIEYEPECVEYVGNSIFMYNNYLVRDPENDIGWRYAYIRTYTSIFYEEVGSQDGHNIINYLNPDYVNED